MSLTAIFYPKSIAIIGASTKSGSVGNAVVKNLQTQGYQGKIYPVNPKAEELYGLKCYPDIDEVPDQVDLIIVAIPAAAVPGIIAPAAAKGAKGCIVISAGFKEVGQLALEQQLKAECEKYQISLVGPNCLGILNPEISLNASFAAILPQPGNVAFCSQSGALCTAVLDYADQLGIGFSKFVSIGNKAQIDEVTLLEYLHNDSQTKVIAMYIEDLKDGQIFRETALKLTKANPAKPIIILKSGRTTAGASASASHTGSLSGTDSAYDALFRQAGVIRANDIAEMFDLIQVFNNNALPEGNKVGIITNAGGPGVLTTDAAVSTGLKMASLTPNTITSLKAYLPAAASCHNPIDILGDAQADRYRFALEQAAADPNVDSILVILTPQSMTEIEATAQAIIDTKQLTHKPLVACLMGEVTVAKGLKLLQQANIASINFPESAAKALAKLSNFADFYHSPAEEQFEFNDLQPELVSKLLQEGREQGVTAFPEAKANQILAAYGFPVLQSFVATSAAEAGEIAQKINQRMVFKIVSKDILHKFDAGGVILNVMPEQAAKTYQLVLDNCQKYKPDAVLEGVLIAEMLDLTRGVEFIIGAKKDAQLGQIIMVGWGGIFVEIFQDVSFSMAPISKTEAQKMITRVKAHSLLNGARGKTKMDEQKLVECLGRLSRLLSDFPEIIELDINPLLILPDSEGVKCLDSRLIFQ